MLTEADGDRVFMTLNVAAHIQGEDTEVVKRRDHRPPFRGPVAQAVQQHTMPEEGSFMERMSVPVHGLGVPLPASAWIARVREDGLDDKVTTRL